MKYLLNKMIQEKIDTLPLTPGVYLMKDSRGEIIYVGKSKSLKKRVQSYFYNDKSHSPKVKKLVQHVKDLDYKLTDTEFEALLLECQLIQRLKPMYNRKMKNPKAYTYIVVRRANGMRRLEVAESTNDEGGSVYFGPYNASHSSVERAVQGILECNKMACNYNLSANAPCLNYSIGLCLGMCLGGETLERYEELMDKLISLLNGSDRSLYEDMENKMLEASGQYDFERAARYRDCLEAVNFLLHKEKVIGFTEENRMIVMLEPLSEDKSKLFLVKRSDVLFSEKYSVQLSEPDAFIAKVRERIIEAVKDNDSIISKEVSRDEIDMAQIIYSHLHHSACHYIFIPDDWLLEERHSEIDTALRGLLASFK